MRAVALLILVLLAVTPVNGGESPVIVVSVKPLALLLKGVVDEEIRVHTLLPAGATPHSFSLKPSQVKLLREADLVVWLGKDIEPYLAGMVSKLPGRVLDLSAYPLVDVVGGEEAEDEAQVGHEDGNSTHHQAHRDPHVWLSWKNGLLFQKQMLLALADMMYGKEGIPAPWRKQMALRKRQLATLYSGFARRFGPQERHLLVYHRAYDYLVSPGYFSMYVVMDAHGDNISMRDAIELQRVINGTTIDCIVVPSVVSTSMIDRLFGNRPYRMVELDPLGWDGEYNDYVQWIGMSLARLKDCASH